MVPLDHGTLAAELDELRHQGLPKLRQLELPGLGEAAQVVVANDTVDRPVAIENLLRRAVERLGGGPYGDAAAALFGLAGGLRGAGPSGRRGAAADALGMSAETFRTRRQKTVVSDLADQVLALLADAAMRVAHRELSRRHPTESRLAVAWVERFEAYYHIWTPVYALGADLTAYRMSLLEADRPYDEPSDGAGGPAYTQELQAEGYAKFALYRYTTFAWELRQFMARHGGMWLFSDGGTETAVTEAVYDISWHVTPYNERDESYLRSVLQDTRGQEMHGFLQTLTRTDTGQATWKEWLDWLATCQCRWEIGATAEAEYFPTRHHHQGIAEDCEVHKVIEACGTYCDLVDQDWRKIADWYHLGEAVHRGRSAEERYLQRGSVCRHLVTDQSHRSLAVTHDTGNGPRSRR